MNARRIMWCNVGVIIFAGLSIGGGTLKGCNILKPEVEPRETGQVNPQNVLRPVWAGQATQTTHAMSAPDIVAFGLSQSRNVSKVIMAWYLRMNKPVNTRSLSRPYRAKYHHCLHDTIIPGVLPRALIYYAPSGL